MIIFICMQPKDSNSPQSMQRKLIDELMTRQTIARTQQIKSNSKTVVSHGSKRYQDLNSCSYNYINEGSAKSCIYMYIY